jgi:hypothetical protein
MVVISYNVKLRHYLINIESESQNKMHSTTQNEYEYKND